MLKEDGGRERIDVTPPTSCRTVHLADGPSRRGRGEAFIDETHGQTGPARNLIADRPYLARSGRILTLFVERKAHHETACFELDRPRDDLRNGRTLSRTTKQKTGWRRDDPARVAHREADSLLPVVDGQQAPRSVGHGWNIARGDTLSGAP